MHRITDFLQQNSHKRHKKRPRKRADIAKNNIIICADYSRFYRFWSVSVISVPFVLFVVISPFSKFAA